MSTRLMLFALALPIMLSVPPPMAAAHEQSAVIAGQRIQPSQETVSKRLREHQQADQKPAKPPAKPDEQLAAKDDQTAQPPPPAQADQRK